MTEINEKPYKICKTHPHSLWGRDQFGCWYPTCAAGKQSNERTKEICEEFIKEKHDEI